MPFLSKTVVLLSPVSRVHSNRVFLPSFFTISVKLGPQAAHLTKVLDLRDTLIMSSTYKISPQPQRLFLIFTSRLVMNSKQNKMGNPSNGLASVTWLNMYCLDGY